MAEPASTASPAPSPYLVALARAYLLAPQHSEQENTLRSLFEEQALEELVLNESKDELLADVSFQLRAEGLLP